MKAKTQAIKARGETDETSDQQLASQLAATAVSPSMSAAVVMAGYLGLTDADSVDIRALMGQLSADVKDVWAGDTKRAEAMLFGQAHALQIIFMELARRANAQQSVKYFEPYLRMALKAQNQSRMTLETLATIKNPPVVIARQANFANGPQQVNNGQAADPGLARAANATSAPTKLQERSHEQWLDARAAGTYGRDDPHLAPVGKIHRPENG